MAFEIGIVEPGDFSEKANTLLQSIGRVELFEPGKESLKDFVAEKNALFVRLRHYWGSELLLSVNKLKYICSPTTGLTHIDMDYAESAQIEVISLKGETDFLRTISATAEHTLGLALALLRRYGHAFLRSDNFTWDRDRFKGYEMKHMRVGIIGMGRIGILLSGYLDAFGAKGYYYDCNTPPPRGWHQMFSLTALVDAVDIIFLCASFENENLRMIDEKILSRMKGKYFINTSRGEMVDEDALLSLIRKDYFAGVALDVVAGEPNATRAKEFAELANAHNLLITPHIGGATYTSMWSSEEFIAEKLTRALIAGSG